MSICHVTDSPRSVDHCDRPILFSALAAITIDQHCVWCLLPQALLGIGRLSPATYAASALRQTLVEPMTGQVVVDLAALVGFSLLTFWFVGLKLDWRQR